MSTNGLVYAPNTSTWAQIRSIEYSYQVGLIADNPAHLRRFMVATQAMQVQALQTANAQLADVNRGILGIQEGIGELTGTVERGFSDLTYAMQDGFDQMGGMIQDGFSMVAVEMQRQNAVLIDIAQLLSTKLEGEAKEIRTSALSAVREGCSPEAFDQDGSLREALQLFRITIEHPMGMRDYVAWFNIGWLLWKLDGNLEEAEKAFATAVRQSMEKKDAFHVMAARHLAYMRFLQNKTDGAYQGIRLALQIDAQNPENLFTQLLIAAQAKNVAELVSTFRTLIVDHPDRLAECLAEPELNPYQNQLQPVVDALVSEARIRVKSANEQANTNLREAEAMAKMVQRETLLSAATQVKIAAVKKLIAGVNLETADWPTMHRLVNAMTTMCNEVARDVDQIRPKLAIIRTIEWVRIPAGAFLYGDTKERLELDTFDIMKYPVTVAQYRQFCDAAGRKLPAPPDWGWQDSHPIVNVTWDDATAFAEWVGVSLPTETQWEKAARGTDGREYPWGNTWDASKCANSAGTNLKSTQPVGSYASGASPYGCMDMAGNVWEWCADWYDSAKSSRVLRGGGWGNNANDTRCACRIYNYPYNGYDSYGFRLVR